MENEKKMIKTGSSGNVIKTDLSEENEQQGITKCAKCGNVYLSAHGSCPICK